ncbi:hypothetical protein GCM10010954_12280 [Halobacillus andaensis]|uniref:YolD-like protein n=1 Tax=Halobacillus andaensis TaxID=1176239 RepID=A0A917EW81_HALAA|nr:hypothetical protein GCM10010954_12280 [Halobacillus andaensis]
MQDRAFVHDIAMKNNLTIEIKYHNGHAYSYSQVKVIGMNEGTKKVNLVAENEKDELAICFYDIFEVTIL